MLKILKWTLIVIIAAVISSWFSYNRIINSRGAGQAVEKVFSIKDGQGVKEISNNLKKEGLVDSPFFFNLYVAHQGWAAKFKAGDYKLSSGQSIREVAAKIVSGDAISKEITLTFKEGDTLDEIASIFSMEGIFSKKSFYDLAGYPRVNYDLDKSNPLPKDYSSEFAFLLDKPANTGLEGYLFPDTYNFYKDAQPDDAIQKMLGNFNKKLSDDLRQEIAKQGKTIFEIVTMASLIEKEVRSLRDMEIVSGIFWKRIKENQPLQLDATLSYVLSDSNPQHEYEETRIDSSYNTYMHKGLTPGPIANPGINAIKAAIYPKDTSYYYFLTTDEGENSRTIYSSTFEEHIRNKAKYLR
jgi:UPF0755 protein